LIGVKIRIAIAGVGNCASSLIQGIHFYREGHAVPEGVMHPNIGSWAPGDIEVVSAFDVDKRKVGVAVNKAIFAEPNCARIFHAEVKGESPIVKMGPVLDGCADHLQDYPEKQRILLADEPPVDVAAVLKASGAEVLVCYLPVGSEKAVRHYAQACLDAGVGMINCVPVFIASDPEWAEKFRSAGVPIVGDDIKSQLGATILHRALARLFSDRGVAIDRTYQLNTGGNTDFLNMLARDRLDSKKISKTQAVQSQLDTPLPSDQIHIGPSDYVPWQKDNKVAFIRMEGAGFGGVPLELECRLSVQDSPNSGGVVIDAIRCVKLALVRKLGGPLEAPSAYYMKSPPKQFLDHEARQNNLDFIQQPGPVPAV
jgi:myo-inositol-1-phosphate synthase